MKSPLKIVFMGTPAFAIPALKALVESEHKVIAVYTQPPRPAGRGQKETPSPVHQFAAERDIPIFTPVSLKSAEEQEKFADLKADIAVVVAYGLLLPKPILEAFPLGCINIHPSALPRWRGAAPIQRTIMAGDKKTEIVIMQMDEGLDTGNMLLKEEFAIPYGTNAGTLHDILAEKSAPLLLKTLADIKNITPQKQPEEGVTYAKKILKEEGKIDWSRPAHEIYQQVLGLSPTPGAFFEYKGEVIKIFDASIEEANLQVVKTKESGTVIDEKLAVICGDRNIFCPKILQRPNKKRMNIDEFLNGFPIAADENLG